MEKHEADALIKTIRSFVEGGKQEITGEPLKIGPMVPMPPANGNGKPTPTALSRDAMEDVYQYVKKRFIDEAKIDPVLLNLIMVQPEIILEFERRVETLDGSSIRGRVAKLIATGFFATARATGAIRKELARLGNDPGGGGGLGEQLSNLAKAGFLLREGDGWLVAPGIKITSKQLETTS